MSVVFVARQQIFDRAARLVGYELLYRPTASAFERVSRDDSLRMTGGTIVTAVLSIGLDQITGKTPAWINFPREMLLRHDFELLDPRRCIIELLESTQCDAATVEACRVLRERGFKLALDDFAGGDDYTPLLELAQFVKLDVHRRSEDELAAIVRRLQGFKVHLLAQQVEDNGTYERCRRLGFSLFQGYHLRRPEVVQRRDLPVEFRGTARLMRLLDDDQNPDRDVEIGFRADPGLSLKLLRIVNSAALGGRGVESILHALQIVGRVSLHRWLALLLVGAAPRANDVDREFVMLALERGRFCEVLAQRSGRDLAVGSLFLAGLLSMFQEILGITMEELLLQVNVSPEVAAALRGEPGPYTPCLRLATSYARGDWPQAIELGEQIGVVDELPECYAEAGGWARRVLNAI